ncbi:hypothetical protein TYRP_017603 [Tyrophagus putrescentiae]|nr:hypothetical protein TYRP_017603 [Tyrophagus putrescentiae]
MPATNNKAIQLPLPTLRRALFASSVQLWLHRDLPFVPFWANSIILLTGNCRCCLVRSLGFEFAI